MTKRLQLTHHESVTLDDHPAIVEAAEVIRAGGLVAFPTETVYGLGANALDANAVARIYEAKQRALNDPLIVHVAAFAPAAPAAPAVETAVWQDQTRLSAFSVSAHQFMDALRVNDLVGDLTEAQAKCVEQLATRFWPGPLTLVLPRGARIPPIVSAGLDTVAVRMPDHPIAQALIRRSGVPIAAPSANRFGHVSPTTAQHVLDDLDGRIDLVLDGGPTHIGVESTVLDLTSDPPGILRPGGVTRGQIAEAFATESTQVTEALEGNHVTTSSTAMKSPGLFDKHYAPNARLIVCRDTADLLSQYSKLKAQNSKLGLLLLDSQRVACENHHPQFVLGRDVNDVARNLYAGLRALDSAGVDVILVTEMPRDGLGEAIADRLARAAAK